jgi:hypothetical protein
MTFYLIDYSIMPTVLNLKEAFNKYLSQVHVPGITKIDRRLI